MSKLTATGTTAQTAIVDASGLINATGAPLPQGTFLMKGVVSATGQEPPFAPSYNGAQAPTVVATSAAKYQTVGASPVASNGNSYCDIWVKAVTGNAEIWVEGDQNGSTISLGGTGATSLTKIFDLNELPDTVSITLTQPVSGTDSGPDAANTETKRGSFTDSADFSPTLNVEYGYDFYSYANASAVSFVDVEFATYNPTVYFTFKKSGFQNLTVTYKVTTEARATATVI